MNKLYQEFLNSKNKSVSNPDVTTISSTSTICTTNINSNVDCNNLPLYQNRKLILTRENCNFKNITEQEKKIIDKFFSDKDEYELELMPFLINACYGGFSLSDEAKILLDKKLSSDNSCIESDNNLNDKDSHTMTDENHENELFDDHIKTFFSPKVVKFLDRDNLRTDPLLIQIANEIGLKKMSNFYSKFEIVGIPSKFVDFIKIDQYDGCENVELNFEEYIQNLLLDDSLPLDKMKSLMLEISFISIRLIFKKMMKFYTNDENEYYF